jgi:3-carboxy-cis,cis-muconate cycloisomerase
MVTMTDPSQSVPCSRHSFRAQPCVEQSIEGLEVDGAPRLNLDTTHGLVMAEALSFALAAKIGKHDGHQLLEGASRKAIAEKRHLRDVLGEDPRITAYLSAREIEHLFDPLSCQGVSQTFIDRMLAQAKTR